MKFLPWLNNYFFAAFDKFEILLENNIASSLPIIISPLSATSSRAPPPETLPGFPMHEPD